MTEGSSRMVRRLGKIFRKPIQFNRKHWLIRQ